MTSLQDPQQLHTTSSPSSLLDLASSLVSPKSFLFSAYHKTPPPSLPPQRAPTMDKSQQPSSFQQLEKVRSPLIFGPEMKGIYSETNRDSFFQLGEGTYATVRSFTSFCLIADHSLNKPFHDRAISMLKEAHHRFSRGEIARLASW